MGYVYKTALAFAVAKASAARLVDAFLKKLLLEQLLVVELTNLAYFNSLGLSIHFLKKLYIFLL